MRLSAECIRLAPHPDGVAVGVECASGDPETVGSHVLLAVGRCPNTDDLGLDKAGIATDSRGYIQVDDFLTTNVPGIWALGECNGRGAFTHTAYNDFEIVAANLLDGEARKVSERILGYALYIDPPMSRVGRAIEKGETQGFMKVVVDAETRKILGAAILGTSGDEAIHGIIDIMNAGMPYTILQRAVPIHPTVSELIPTLFGEMQPFR
jgi:pyruvate/2-oxoglutarate dehydrogenase complex dihydrolipoamide dehydrogenase (E3) component